MPHGLWLTGAGVEPEKTLSIGCPRGLFVDMAEPRVRAMMEEVKAKLQQNGARITDMDLPPAFAEVLPRHRTVMAVEAAAFHEKRLRHHSEDYQPCIRRLLQEGLECPATEYTRCKEHQRALKDAMINVLLEYKCLLTPATTGPAPDSSTTGNPAFNSPWSYTGLPTVCFPSGHFVNGLPLAIQLVGAVVREESLLEIAAWCEKTLGVMPLSPPS
jgi:aspartyl-tRNA(Asn)/glutamyl-tRNA(Gln) amidotransferase subunit A